MRTYWVTVKTETAEGMKIRNYGDQAASQVARIRARARDKAPQGSTVEVKVKVDPTSPRA